MNKYFFIIFTLLLFSIVSVNSANVEVISKVYDDKTTFEYSFFFSNNESPNSFSLEKPIGSKLDFAKSGNIKLKYSSVGDFFIFENTNPKSNNFTIKFTSQLLSENIIESKSFSTYMNFNFPVENLKFSLSLKNKFGKVMDVFPRNYELISTGDYFWSLNKVSKDTFFLINFDPNLKSENFFSKNFFWISISTSLLILVIFLLIFIKFFKKKEIKKEEIKDSSSIKIKKEPAIIGVKENSQNEVEVETVVPNKTNLKTYDDNFEEILEKYLTQNEREIVLLVREFEGISQNDILNNIPTLTKSNLSKIISKLDSRRILNKIKVGKINKIHLGDKFEVKEN